MNGAENKMVQDEITDDDNLETLNLTNLVAKQMGARRVHEGFRALSTSITGIPSSIG